MKKASDNVAITDYLWHLKKYTAIFIFVGVGSFIIWLLFAKISTAIIANGFLRFDRPPLSITKAAGQQVETINVSNGQEVAKGDVLFKYVADSEQNQLERLVAEYNYWLGLKDEVINSKDASIQKEYEGNSTIVTNKINSEQDSLQTKYIVIQKLSQLLALIEDTKKVISSKVVRAPYNGVVYDLNSIELLNNQQQEILKITPNGNKFIVDVTVDASKRTKINIGNRSRITFPSLTGKGVLTINGTIDEISSQATYNESSGRYVYSAVLTIDDIEDLENQWDGSLVEGIDTVTYLNVEITTPFRYFFKSISESMHNVWKE